MIPRLFEENATAFTSNGLGSLSDALTCEVTEELNGIFELEMTYPMGGSLYSQLVTSAIIFAEPHEGRDPQAFRIYKISKPINGIVSIFARHISYQTNWIPVLPFTASSLSDCFAKLKTNSASTNPFTLWTNKTVTSGIAWTVPQSFRACLGGTQGSVLQIYGGDYEWDNWTIKLWSRRGSDNGVRIAYGKNLTDAKQEANIETTYTGVCPFWSDEETQTVVMLPEKYILASTASDFPFERIKTVDFSSDFDEQPTVAQLRARTNQYITANHIGHPVISIDVNFVALWQTEEYAGIASLEQVQLGDTVTVDIDRLGITETARAVAYTYDVLKGRYRSITIGDAKSSFAKTFVAQGQAIEASLGEAKAYTGKAVAAAKSYATSYTDSEVDQAIAEAEATAQELTQNATSWLTAGNGFVVANKNADGSWKELLFLDKASTATAKKVLRINENGLGFSSNGIGGPYKQAWTLDGRLVVGGTDAVTISAVDGSNPAKTIFNVNKDGISWLLKSSIMTKNGVLYFLASNATATSGYVMRLSAGGIYFSRKGYNAAESDWQQAWKIDGTLVVGGTDKVNLSAVNASGKEIFGVTKDGISWSSAQSIMTKNGALHFLASGANATKGNVIRINNQGISFSKNGYNGTYKQMWNIRGDMVLGGSYGSFTVEDDNGHTAVLMDGSGLNVYKKNASGDDVAYGWVDTRGLYIYDNDDDSEISAMPGSISLTDDNGNGATYSAEGLSVAGTYIGHDDEEGVNYVQTEELRANTVRANELIIGGSEDQGITQTVNLPGNYQLVFENGMLTGYTRGASPLEGWVEIPCEGDTMIFNDGILYDLESMSDLDDGE